MVLSSIATSGNNLPRFRGLIALCFHESCSKRHVSATRALHLDLRMEVPTWPALARQCPIRFGAFEAVVQGMGSKMAAIDESTVDSLLSNTDLLFSNIHAFQFGVHKIPGKSHRGLCITHQDLNERKDQFISELRNTMSSWVYSKEKFKKILGDLEIERGGDIQNAHAELTRLVKSKFRTGYPNGQFGELLLFNLIQHYYKAAPLLRKMPITTSPNVERHGADAIHYRPSAGLHTVYLGEAKSYPKSGFRASLNHAVESIMGAHDNFQTEIQNYVNDGFIDDQLVPVATKIKNNALQPLKVELVCIASYGETKQKSGASETEIKKSIEKIVNERICKFNGKCINGCVPAVLSRLHLFVMPFWKFPDLLTNFED